MNTGKAEAEAAALKNFGEDNAVTFIKPGLIDGSPPGPKDISPDDVAKATVAAALGQVPGGSSSLDGYDAITSAASAAASSKYNINIL